jgi:hypothetical protein
VEIEDDRVVMSPLMMWYSRDFGYTNKQRVHSVSPFLEPAIRARVEALVQQHGITWAPYNWSFA